MKGKSQHYVGKLGYFCRFPPMARKCSSEEDKDASDRTYLSGALEKCYEPKDIPTPI
ncbi:hypothetical protein [Spirulina sp. 06S082]|uniref:hypothetical protein n=1 Tax=Spirulina sp. 06S082 TaxID=3110248 RepID=UPI002B1F3025|nr:hypothetical protein [Spirulina sp. 06S082]MEA5469144.1 hypothetical protein [Spirulina sp. 06S082]